MATVAGSRSAYATLTSNTVDTVTLSGHWKAVEVSNKAASGGTTLIVTVATDPNGAAPATPVASADETFEVPAGTSLVIENPTGAATQWRVSILGNGNAYGVVGQPSAGIQRTLLYPEPLA